MARIRVYKNSIVASILSVIGYTFLMIGIVVAVNESVPGGIIIALLGVGLAIWGARISEKKQFRTWKNKIESTGLTGRIREDVNVAVMVYNSNPSKQSLSYISQLNPVAGELIAENLRSRRKQK